MSTPRPVLTLVCPHCARRHWAQRVRGKWRGVVRLLSDYNDDSSHRVVELLPHPQGWSNRWPCRRCREAQTEATT